MKKKRKLGRKLQSFLLTLAMVVGLMPGMGLTAYAAGEKAYAAYDVTTETNKTKSVDDLKALQVTFNDRKWYIIEDNSSSATSGTVTLLSADTSFGTKTFDSDSNKYSTSQVKTYLDSMTGTGGAFADVAEAIKTVDLTTNKYDGTDVYETVSGVKLYLLSTEEAKSLPVNVRKAGFTGGNHRFNEWWLRSPGYWGDYAAFVYGEDGIVPDNSYNVKDAIGVRPALKLKLESVIFSSESQTFTVGSAKEEQTITASDVTATFGDTGKKIEASTTGDGTLSYAVKSGDAVTVDASSGALTIVKVGTATVTVTASETDTYAQATKDVNVTVNKANAIAATVTENNRTYDGTEKLLVTVDDSTLVGGEMQYALGGNAATDPADSLYTTSIPTATNAGTYSVWYKVVGDDNHNGTEPKKIEAKISANDKSDLEDAIEEADEYFEKILENEDYQDIAETLKEKIADAYDVLNNDNVTKEEIAKAAEELRNALQDAKDAVKAIEDAKSNEEQDEESQDKDNQDEDTNETPADVDKDEVNPGSDEGENTTPDANKEQADPTDNTDVDPTKNDDSSKKDTYNYSNEWVDGLWYSSDGSQTYKPVGHWEQDDNGWYYIDEAGWFPRNMWQKIDGYWYFFDETAYMCTNQYCGSWDPYLRGAWWVGADGRWDGSACATWNMTDGTYWFGDTDGWFAHNGWLKICGYWYYFDSEGWMLSDCYIGPYYVGEDGAWQP